MRSSSCFTALTRNSPFRSCPRRSGSPRALPASAASACLVWHQAPAPPAPRGPAAACIAPAPASRSGAIGMSARPCGVRSLFAISLVARTIPASHGRLPPRRCTLRRPFRVPLRYPILRPLPRLRRCATMPRPSAIFPASRFPFPEFLLPPRPRSLLPPYLQIHLPPPPFHPRLRLHFHHPPHP